MEAWSESGWQRAEREEDREQGVREWGRAGVLLKQIPTRIIISSNTVTTLQTSLLFQIQVQLQY